MLYNFNNSPTLWGCCILISIIRVKNSCNNSCANNVNNTEGYVCSFAVLSQEHYTHYKKRNMTKKKVIFTLPSESVANAAEGILLGEFNNWNPEEGIHLQKKEDGSMIAELSLTAGKTYEYRYLLSDGRWVNDNNGKTFSDVYGHAVENCVLTVPAPVKKATAEKTKTVKKEKAVVVADDLTKIEGVGKKITALLAKENIRTYKELAKTSIKKLQLMLDTAGSKFNVHDPATWPKQAKLAAAGDWETLASLQEELKGGK